MGYTITLASGQMDLSVGAIVSLTGVLYALASKIMPLWVAIILALVIAVLCKFVNGMLIQMFTLPAFVLTMAMTEVYRGITHVITDAKTVGSLSEGVKYLGQGRLFGVIPVPFVITIVVVILVAILLSKTLYGRHLIATGGNAQAADVSGINTGRIKVTAHMVGGICIGIGAIVLTGRVAAATPTGGDGYGMDAIAAVVIGGTPMRGGKAKVVGTLFGVLLIGIISNMLNLLGVSSYWQWVAKGVIIIIAIVLDSMTDKIVNLKRIQAS